ncbi:MAG: hypothetical protein E6R04_06865 [Spirochaetes bacterium]|nr:MAG: hypothetical protein E6R04_06865 [Spirochaetota bacterium]
MTASVSERIHAAMDVRGVSRRGLRWGLNDLYADGAKIVKRVDSARQGLSVSEITSICTVLDIPLEWVLEGGDSPVPPRLSPVEKYRMTLLASSLNFKRRVQVLRRAMVVIAVCALVTSVVGGYLVVSDTLVCHLTGVSTLVIALAAAVFLGYAWSKNSPSAAAAQEAALNDQLADLNMPVELGHMSERLINNPDKK